MGQAAEVGGWKGGSCLKFLSVCSGIEAATAAWAVLGWTAVAYCEIEPFPSAVLAYHHKGIPNLGDLRNFLEWDEELLAEVEAVAGGTPCQAFSVAGLRESLADDRGNLTLIYVQLIDHIDRIRARYGRPPVICIWENVPGVLSTTDNAYGCFLAALAGESVPLTPPGERWTYAGYVRGPVRAIAWRSFDAQYFGLAQRRLRVFAVASARPGFRPEEILFESEGVRRDSPPSRETGERTAPTLSARTQGGGGLGTDFELDGGLIPGLAFPLTAGMSASAARMPHEQGALIPQPIGVDYTNCLITGGISGTLEAAQDRGNRGLGVLAFDTTQVTSLSNYSNPRPGDPCHPLAAGAHAPAVAFTIHGTDGTSSVASETDTAGCLRTKPPGSIENSSTTVAVSHSGEQWEVRRLMPIECERLQGFEDNHTLIPWRGKPADQCPDGPRYKALGNSWAVTNAHWLGRRIDRYMREVAA